METFASSFTTGLNKPVIELLKKELKDINIIKSLEGLIIYKTNIDIDELIKKRYLTNTFLVLCSSQNIPKSNPGDYLMKYAIKVKLPILKKHIPKKNKTFRIFTTHENKHIKPNRNLIKRLESKIISMTDLKLNLNYPNIEFYILSRTEGYGYFLMKLSKKQKTKPGKGELRRELAHMLCRISNPSDNDIFLDPFAGTGTIPKERIIIGPYMKIYVNDKERLINKSLRNYQNSKIIIMREDALNMSLYENSITHIVTDPPWGIFKELPMKIERFYDKLFEEFYRILIKGGRIVILTANKSKIENIFNKNKRFLLEEKYDILVNGKKAGIYIAHKI
tara:strand:- start:2335 stop:3339 length:1005 start_codon:yes stop_codon:yes gene_type:complete